MLCTKESLIRKIRQEKSKIMTKKIQKYGKIPELLKNNLNDWVETGTNYSGKIPIGDKYDKYIVYKLDNVYYTSVILV